MLMNIKSKLEDPIIHELIGLAVIPEPELIDKAIKSYINEPAHEIMGYFIDEELIGLIGYQMQENSLVIKHLAIVPEEQGHGYGRGIILEILHLKSPQTIVAETDEDAINFYRSIGFTIESLGEKYPGVERFKCTYDVEENEKD